jgi:hypothetical protein
MDKSLQKLMDELTASVRGLDCAQTQLRPLGREKAWSIQQIVEHLLLTYVFSRKVMVERLEKGTATKRPPSLSNRCAQFAVTKAGFFPRGIRAPEMVEPPRAATPRNGEELAASVEAEIALLEDVAGNCESVLGSGRAVTHFALGPMSIAQWKRFHLTHARHHVKQILSIRRQNGLLGRG